MAHDAKPGESTPVLDPQESYRRLQALRQSESVLKAIMRSDGNLICVKDCQGRIVMANQAMLEFLGRGPDVIGTDDLDSLDGPDLVAKIRENNRRVLEDGVIETVEETVETPKGRMTMLFTKSPLWDSDGNVVGIMGVGTDNTRRAQAQKSLADSERKYRLLHESIAEAIVFVEMNGRVCETNEAYRAMLGYSAEELSRLTYVDLTPKKWHGFEADLVRTQIIPRGYSDVYAKEYRKKDGTIFPVELRTYLLRDDRGEPAGMWAIVRDITERQKAVRQIEEARDELEKRVAERTAELSSTVESLRQEIRERERIQQSLAQSEALHRTTLLTAMDGFWRADERGNLVEVNDAYCRMSGYSRRELLQMRIADLEVLETNADVQEHIRRIQTLGQDRFESRHRRKDGSIYDVDVCVKLQPSDGGWGVAFIRDITGRKQAQQALEAAHRQLLAVREAEQRRIARELHDSVAQHAVGLQLMLNNVRNWMINLGTAEGDPLHPSLQVCTDLVREIREICHGLYPQNLEVFGLATALKELLNICSNAGLKTEVFVDPEAGACRFSPDVEIAVYRIAQDAATNAMRHSRATNIAVHLLTDRVEGTLVLAVTDNGAGFAGEPQSSAGLGLVSMRERAMAIGGKLTVQTRPTGGTTVFLGVPLAHAQKHRVP